jgi:hypothetical protein
MLQRWHKNRYFGDSYSLSKSFWARTAQINRLTGRASQSALEAATPSSPGYDGGAHFHRRARQGCQKSARIKMLVDNTYGDKILSMIQIDFIIRAVKDKKRPKWQKWPPNSQLPSLPPYAWSGGKTADAASLKKAQATSNPIFKPKRPNHRPRAGFCGRTKKRTPLAPQ